MLDQPIVALWMYQDLGGEKITHLLKKQLQDHGIKVVTGFDLRQCIICGSKVYTPQGLCLNHCRLLFQMNADEQSPFQNSVLQILEIQGVIILNSTSAFNRARDKLVTNISLDSVGLKVPMTISLDRPVLDPEIQNLCAKWPAILLKPKGCHGGKGIVKWSNFEQLKDGWSLVASNAANYYLESYVPFNHHDYRIEIIDGKYAGGYSRQKSHEFKTNISTNGGLMGLKSPKVCIKIAQKAVQLLKLDCSIVDIVQHRYTGEYFVLEVNPALGVFNEAAVKSGTPVLFRGNESYKNDDLKLHLLTKLIVNKLKMAPVKSGCSHPNISNSLLP